MIRLASWLVASLAISGLIAWLISLPGTIRIDVGGYTMQPRLGMAVFLLLVIVIVGIAIWSIIRRLLGAPRYFARRAAVRRREQGVEALSNAFIALQAGDAGSARLLARDAKAKLPGNSAAQLLEARADLALGDMPAARENYRALISDSRTAVAALAGLYDQARTQGRPQAALGFAEKAMTIAPETGWANAAVFDDLTRRQAWDEALVRVNAEAATTRDDRARKRRRQAVLETAIARAAETGDPLKALDHALSALKLLPDFVPAALIAARIQANRGDTRKAMSLLRRVWRATHHPDVALAFANAQSGASAVDRLKRVRELIDMPPESRSAAVVLARAAIDAYEWRLAQDALASFANSEPTQAVASLMAEIEEGQNADQGKARQWLAKAVHAARDPVWTADGVTSDEWEPTSPVTGKLDAFEWKVPVSTSAKPSDTPPADPNLLALPSAEQ